MRCPSCAADNRPSAKFCAECGHAFLKKCGACGDANDSIAKFCNECGTPFVLAVKKRETGPRGGPVGERRQLTVMFCDLVAATELSGRLDPEDLREVIGAFQKASARVIERYEGHVAQHLGDGLLVYFGYPRAHEDDAVRSALAALGVIEAVNGLNAELSRGYDVRLQVRIGVHTGATVIGSVGEGEASEQLAIGETPNLAARLQSCADPDTVVVSAETERLLRSAFRCDSKGRVALKGFADAREIFTVVEPRAGGEASFARTPLVGREAESSALAVLVDQACSGSGCAVLIRGDAGVGKSRLCGVISELVSDRANLRELRARGSTFFTHTPFEPVGGLLRGVSGVSESDDPAARWAALGRLISELGVSDPDALLLLGPLAGAEPASSAAPAPLSLTPQIRKARTLAVLVEVFIESARRTPLVIVVEDVHWVDESTLELIGALTEGVAGVGLLLALTARTHFRAPWAVQSEISLHRLPRSAIERIVDSVSDGRLPRQLVGQILLKADGNPLFAEELAHMVVESGLLERHSARSSGETPVLAIPSTLKDSLMARLDRLSPARKSLVQLCSTLGRRFSEELLREILRSFEEDMQNELRRLTEGELLYQRGVPPRSLYVFRHALVQDAAYESLLRRTRRQYHGRVADVLMERFPDTPAEVLAHHLTEADRPAAAIDLWHAAGAAALAAFALRDAMSHLTRGLRCVESLPEGSLRLQKELELRGTLGVPLMLTQGFAAPDVVAHYARTLELCELAGDDDAEQLFPALWGVWTSSVVSGQFPKAERVATKLRCLGERLADHAILLAGHTGIGTAALMRGQLTRAVLEFEAALALYDPDEHASLAMLFGQDAGAMCHSFLTWAYVHIGDDEAARHAAAEADAVATRLAQPSTRAFVDTVLATWCCVAGDTAQAIRRSDIVIGLSVEQGMPHWAAQANITRGWALALDGRGADGAEGLRAGIEALTAMGSMATMTFYWAGLAELELSEGRLEEARLAISRARAYMARSDERLYEAALLVLEGRVAEATDETVAAAVAYRAAIQVASAAGADGTSRRAAARLGELS